MTGPDHLAGLLPLCTGRSWNRAAAAGALWGIGHGVGSALVGLLAFALRQSFNIEAVSGYMEVAVGVSIFIIGFNGFRESREWADAADQCTLPDEPDERADGDLRRDPVFVAACLDEVAAPAREPVLSTLTNGVLNGFCGTGHVLGVMPALAMPSWAVAGAYLGCFGVGTFVAMALFTGLVGELTSGMGRQLDDPAAPANFAAVSSVFALVMGTFWTGRALASLGLPGLAAALLSRAAALPRRLLGA